VGLLSVGGTLLAYIVSRASVWLNRRRGTTAAIYRTDAEFAAKLRDDLYAEIRELRREGLARSELIEQIRRELNTCEATTTAQAQTIVALQAQVQQHAREIEELRRR
jgi:metal-responsive CopG/Arc/MetJ family transcriptional regulator